MTQPTRFSTSTGQPALDRRLGFAEAMASEGAFADAAEVVASILEEVPGWIAGWVRLGEYRQGAGQIEAARDAWHAALALDPSDPLGALLLLDLTGPVPVIERMPSAFVETLFDQYAPRFEDSLVKKLDYRGPEVLARSLAGRRFARALDLGCGTGLAGQVLRSQVDGLEGYDISAAMLAQAARKGCYDLLEKRDLTALVPGAGPFDLIVAADVFNYLGALDRIISWCRAELAPGGVLAFTVEALEGGGFALRETRRFAHSAAYVRALLEHAGFAGISLSEATLRKDRAEPVKSLVVVAEIPARATDRTGEEAGALA